MYMYQTLLFTYDAENEGEVHVISCCEDNTHAGNNSCESKCNFKVTVLSCCMKV